MQYVLPQSKAAKHLHLPKIQPTCPKDCPTCSEHMASLTGCLETLEGPCSVLRWYSPEDFQEANSVYSSSSKSSSGYSDVVTTWVCVNLSCAK